jgi:methylaspartate ammonia-lyase
VDPHIERIDWVRCESGYFRDDQAAIRVGAPRDGFAYDGSPLTPGFAQIREPGLVLTVLLHLSDGHVVTGDCAEVQYPGVGGRAAPLTTASGAELVETVLRPALIGRPVAAFRTSSAALADLELPPWARYGASQALLRAAAHAGRRPMARVVCDEWDLELPRRAVPVFAQSGEQPHDAVDRMVLKRVDALPHGLINNVETRLGRRGEKLLELVAWLRDRILRLAGDDPDYRPVLHFDTYATPGLAFGAVGAVADYLLRLEQAAAPFALRIEHPLDAGSRAAQIEQLGTLRTLLRERGGATELVADEWCNTLEDIDAFARAGCVDMIQVKTPDVGGFDDVVEALLTCRRHGVQAYCGGTCNETVGSAQVSAQVALACRADLIVAKPGMGVDEGLSVVRNEMAIALARLGHDAPPAPAPDGYDAAMPPSSRSQ